ncbi:isochorismatase family protein [Helicobacter salomonis]|uniref:isochorismatase family protein n=2 Tax=Helicobacter salomonis TaxID=56878 RepID=UPI001F2943BF|nr:isochorismatase family protein [Helicobacter salomonis]
MVELAQKGLRMPHVIVIDIQEKLLPAMAESDILLANCLKFLRIAQILKLPIHATEQNPIKLGSSITPLRAFFGSPYVKEHFSAAPVLISMLPPQAHLVLLGIEAHVCVYQSAKDFLQAGFTVSVLEDCTSSRDTHNKKLALTDLQNCGAHIVSTEMVAFECMQTYTHPNFKTISQIIK